MAIPSDINQISFKNYYQFGRILDYIWTSCSRRGGNVGDVKRYMPIMVRWRTTINKMRIYSSTELSLAEKLNYGRAARDLDSLLFRLSKVAGAIPVKVSGDAESESEGEDDAESEDIE